MEKKCTLKKPLILLCVALVIMLASGAAAGLVQSSGCKTDISRISFDTANGTLSGLLYLPEGASAESPRPTVVVTHGYLNSAEMQDANAIELSRRGYVVLALDMYDHGHSKLASDKYMVDSLGAFMGCWMPFWLNSMQDAVAYMYEQPYVLKDENGNGIIGVTGHSMGGFSTTLALAFDEMYYPANGVRKIYCGLTEGSDFSYTAFAGVDVATADALGAGRIMGKVAAQFDEFFFNDPAVQGGTVRHKDYVATAEAKTWLEQEAPEAGVWYDTADGGRRIIYQPAQTHPWNHFSGTTTANAIEFYTTAFAPYSEGLESIDAGSQVWQWKEAIEFIGLIGFVMFIIAAAMVLMEVPFFRFAKTEAVQPAPRAKGIKAVIIPLVLIALVVFMAGLYSPASDSDTKNGWMIALFWVGIAAGLAGIYGIVTGFIGKKTGNFIAGGAAVVSGGLMALLSKSALFSDGLKWVAPGVNPVAAWTLICAVIVLGALSVMYIFGCGADKFSGYGLASKALTVPAGLLTAIVSVAAAYGVLYLVDALFKTDFRIWVYAFKTFDCDIIPAALKYLPVFLLFYFISAVSIFVNTNKEHTGGVKGYLIAILLNAGDAILWLAVQYIVLFATGTAFIPGAALSGIVLVATGCTLVTTAVIARALYKRSGNIWTAAFINGILVTIMTIANTTVFFK
ncbi:MAG: hypothetical protein CW338_06770 [Clostridiales bacterium]|nr:hypothetical protein [Clostridiales bacterium]